MTHTKDGSARMKILAIIDSNPFIQSSAYANRFLSLTTGLEANGNEIDLIIINSYLTDQEKKQFKSKGNFASISYEYLLPLKFAFPNRRIMRILFNKLIPSRFYAYKIRKKIKSNKYDYIWISFSPKLIRLGLCFFRSKLPVKYFHEQSEYSWIGLENNNKLHKLYLNSFLPQLDVFSIMTNNLIDYYKNFVGSKTRIIHLPMTVDFSRFDNTCETNNLNKPYIGYCGIRNFKNDGVDILTKAFIKIMNEFPEYYLYIAGPLEPRNDYNYVKSIVENNNASERIIFLGPMDKTKIPSFLKNASILALARVESKQAEGGFPTKLGEYLATGNPVCVTKVGEIPNYLINNKSAFLSEPNSVDSFAETLKRAITSPEAKNIGKMGQHIAYKYFNKDIQSKKLSDFLANNLL